MTKFVVTFDTIQKRAGISYTGDGPQTDLSVDELYNLAEAYSSQNWERLHKVCSSAIYHSRDKPYFDPDMAKRKVILYLAIAFAVGLFWGGVFL